MSGFHAEGYEAAEEALNDEYKKAISALLSKLDDTPPSRTQDRKLLSQQIARCKEAHREAISALEWSLF